MADQKAALDAVIAAANALNRSVVEATIAGLHIHLNVDASRTRSVSSAGVEHYPGVVPTFYTEVHSPLRAPGDRR